ncbi:MAG: AAA family ATPase [Candidatus Omnitrophota bacterium]
MKIKTLRIQNLRSFGPQLLSIDLSHADGYFVVAGLNAAGKSNLLEALRWITLQKNIGGDLVESWDFHKGNTENPIKIEAELDPPLKHGDTFNKFSDVGLLRFEAKEYKIGEEKGSVRCEHSALTPTGQPILTDMATKLAKGRELTSEEKEGRQKTRPLMVREINGRIPIYYLDNASYHWHLSMQRGSLMSFLSKILHDDLLRDANRINWHGKDCTREEAIKEVLAELGGLLKTDRVDAILSTMADFMTAQLQLPPKSLGLEIGLPGGMDLLKKLDFLGKDDAEVPLLPFERLGRGYSALGIVALFRALNNLGDSAKGNIILIEEPEIFLGSHLRALFASTLQKFAKMGNQVIVITHSAEFFDPAVPESAILLKKESGATTPIQWPAKTKAPSFDITLKFIEPNLDRLIFSQRVLFLEGDDDYAAVQAALALKGIVPAYYGLEILRLGGFGNIVHLAPYANNFQILQAAFLDADAKNALLKIDPSSNSWKVMNPNLEGVLKTTKQSENSRHVAELIQACGTWDNLRKTYPDFAVPLEEIFKILKL